MSPSSKPTITVEEFELQVFRASGTVAEAAEALDDDAYFSATHYDGTLWIVAPSDSDLGEIVERACRLLRINGSSDFPTGLSGILAVLGANGVGVIPIGSYGGDHILVKLEHLRTAIDSLTTAGYQVVRGG